VQGVVLGQAAHQEGHAFVLAVKVVARRGEQPRAVGVVVGVDDLNQALVGAAVGVGAVERAVVKDGELGDGEPFVEYPPPLQPIERTGLLVGRGVVFQHQTALVAGAVRAEARLYALRRHHGAGQRGLVKRRAVDEEHVHLGAVISVLKGRAAAVGDARVGA